ncbi:IS3 family transposase [Bacillus swezeyi]
MDFYFNHKRIKAKLKGMSPVQYGFMPELPKK